MHCYSRRLGIQVCVSGRLRLYCSMTYEDWYWEKIAGKKRPREKKAEEKKAEEKIADGKNSRSKKRLKETIPKLFYNLHVISWYAEK